MSFTVKDLQNFDQKNLSSDKECENLLKVLLPLLDQSTNYNEVSEAVIEILEKNIASFRHSFLW